MLQTNKPPFTANYNYFYIDEGLTSNVILSNYYSDPDGDILTATLFTDCTWCSVTSSGSSYILTLKPCTGNIGVTDITTTITDNNSVGDSAGVLSTPLISRIDVQRKSGENNGNAAPVFSPLVAR